MWNGLHTGLSIFVALVAASPTHAAHPLHLASRQVILTYHTDGPSDGVEAALWVSTDGGRTWASAAVAPNSKAALCYEAPADGQYDFYIVLKNAAGTSAEPPQAGSKPTATVVVDTVPPLLQIHDTSTAATPDGGSAVVFKVSLVEEHLSGSGVRVFYRTNSAAWHDGGAASFAAESLTWTVPPDLGPIADLRVVATDLAGNSASADLHKFSLPAHPPQSADEPPSSTAQPPGASSPAPETRPSAPDTPPTPASTADLRRLRELASRFAGEGQYSLAAARLEDALRLAPQDADVLTDLGNVLFRLSRYQDADARFQTAAQASPDHAGALEGLALVAATEKRYPDAREHLLHLLRVQPASGENWLRYGDIEHQIGNMTQAHDAWEHVLRIPAAPADTRAKAQRRLDYFQPGRSRGQ